MEYLPRARSFKLSTIQTESATTVAPEKKKDADTKDKKKPKKKIKWGFGKKKDTDKDKGKDKKRTPPTPPKRGVKVDMTGAASSAPTEVIANPTHRIHCLPRGTGTVFMLEPQQVLVEVSNKAEVMFSVSTNDARHMYFATLEVSARHVGRRRW